MPGRSHRGVHAAQRRRVRRIVPMGHLGARVLAIIVPFMTVSPTASAMPVPAIELSDVINRSDVIVIGHHTETIGPLDKPNHEFIHVDLAIKGPVASGSDLNLGERPHSNKAWSSYGIFFFRNVAGHLEFADPDVPKLVAAPPGFERFGRQTSPFGQMAAAIVSVFSIPPDAAINPELGLASLSLGVPGPRGNFQRATPLRAAEQVYIDAMIALRSIPFSVKQPFLADILDSNGPLYGRLWAYATLLRSGDTSRLESVTAYLLHPSEQAQATNEVLKQVLQANIYEDDMAPFFARILASTNQSIREGAVVQLGGFRSSVALTALEVALHDEDPQVRQYALGAVCQHVHVCGQTPLKDLAQRQNIPPIANAYRQWLNASARSE